MDLEDVRAKIESEGFEYTFLYYSKFSDLKDERFHELRAAYVAAHKALAEYIGVDE